jgi:hypothetical protein
MSFIEITDFPDDVVYSKDERFKIEHNTGKIYLTKKIIINEKGEEKSEYTYGAEIAVLPLCKVCMLPFENLVNGICPFDMDYNINNNNLFNNNNNNKLFNNNNINNNNNLFNQERLYQNQLNKMDSYERDRKQLLGEYANRSSSICVSCKKVFDPVDNYQIKCDECHNNFKKCHDCKTLFYSYFGQKRCGKCSTGVCKSCNKDYLKPQTTQDSGFCDNCFSDYKYKNCANCYSVFNSYFGQKYCEKCKNTNKCTICGKKTNVLGACNECNGIPDFRHESHDETPKVKFNTKLNTDNICSICYKKCDNNKSICFNCENVLDSSDEETYNTKSDSFGLHNTKSDSFGLHNTMKLSGWDINHENFLDKAKTNQNQSEQLMTSNDSIQFSDLKCETRIIVAHNNGNICWGNAMIQALLSLDSFNNLVKEIVTTSENFENQVVDVTQQNLNVKTDRISELGLFYYKFLVQACKIKNEKPLAMKTEFLLKLFIDTLRTTNEWVLGKQEDVSEFLTLFIDSLKSKEIEKLFEMKYCCKSWCWECEKVSYQSEQIMTQFDFQSDLISIDDEILHKIDNVDVKHETDNNLNNLNNLITKHASIDDSKSYKCELCNNKVNVIRTYNLIETQKIITICFMHDMKKEKSIPNKIKFTTIEGKEIYYSLRAMINHYGSISNIDDYKNKQHNFGHYTATCVRKSLNDENVSIYEFNDMRYESSSFDNSSRCYIAFFEIDL